VCEKRCQILAKYKEVGAEPEGQTNQSVSGDGSRGGEKFYIAKSVVVWIG